MADDPSRHGQRRHWLVPALVTGVLAAGCGGGTSTATAPGTPAGTSPSVIDSASSTASDPLLELHRTGGLAGADDAVRLDRSGAWSATRREGPSTGRLTDATRDAVRALVGARGWAREGAATPRDPCPDGFRYTVTAAGATATTDDCRLPSQPALAELVAAVVGGTGL